MTKAPGVVRYIQGATENEGLNSGSNDVDILTGAISVGYQIRESTELIILFSYVHGFEKEIDSKKYDQDHLTVAVGVRF